MAFVLALPAVAQQTAGFSVNSEVGCAPFTITVSEDVSETGSTYTIYDYDVGQPETTETSFTYTAPGSYTITQTTNNDNAISKVATKTITVLAPEQPGFTYSLCKGRKVVFRMIDAIYPSYNLDFGDGTASQVVVPGQEVEHLFGAAGTYNVTLQGMVNGNDAGEAANLSCGTATLSITPNQVLPAPVLDNVQVMDDVSAQVAYTISPNQDYQLQVSLNGSGTFNPVSQPTTSGEVLIEDLNTTQNYYCFRIAATDPCDGTSVFSNVVCTSNLVVTAENNQNRLEWNTAVGNVQSYEIIKNNSVLSSLGTPSPTNYVDVDVECKQEYCYQVRTNFASGYSLSNTICVIGESDDIPPTVINPSVNAEGTHIIINWPAPNTSAASYYIEESSSEGDFIFSGESSTNEYKIEEPLSSENYKCFRIFYTDDCGNTSEKSVEICPILLNVTENEDHHFELVWTPYSGWADGIGSYIVEKLDEEGNVFDSIVLPSSTNFYLDDFDYEDRQVIHYRVKAVSNNPQTWESISNKVTVEQPIKVFFPSAFTPNGDHINDEFIAKGKFIKESQMKIFNRWGELLHVTDDKARGWDGIYNNKPAPEGSYVYSYEARDYRGKTISLKGSFILIRK